MSEKNENNVSEWTDEQEQVWKDFRCICFESNDCLNGKKILFSEEEINRMVSDAKASVSKHAIDANIVPTEMIERVMSGIYNNMWVHPTDAIEVALGGIYDSNLSSPFYHKLGLLVLKDPRVVAAVKERKEILALLREKVLPDLIAKADDPEAGVMNEIDFGDGNNCRANEVAEEIASLYLKEEQKN